MAETRCHLQLFPLFYVFKRTFGHKTNHRKALWSVQIRLIVRVVQVLSLTLRTHRCLLREKVNKRLERHFTSKLDLLHFAHLLSHFHKDRHRVSRTIGWWKRTPKCGLYVEQPLKPERAVCALHTLDRKNVSRNNAEAIILNMKHLE